MMKVAACNIANSLAKQSTIRIRSNRSRSVRRGLQGKLSGPTNVWRLGIEMDRFQRAVNYAFLTKHPGDSNFSAPIGQNSILLCQQKM